MLLYTHIKHAICRQKAYNNGKPFDVAYLKALLSYVVEETVEINRELTEGEQRYKLFKPESPVNKEALAEEIADLLIHAFNVAGVAEDLFNLDIDRAVAQKLRKNYTRDDHNVYSN